jgi:Tol biopolymer transport system component
MRKLIVLGLLAGLALAALFAIPAGAKSPGANGRIVFARLDPSAGDTFTYTVNPDGSHVQQLFSAHPSNTPHWSPDGSEVAIFCCDDGMAAHFVNPDTGSFREVAPPDPTLETHCGFSWSPDGQRLACESFGVTDPSRNGVYSIRASDGGGLTRITSSPPGGGDIPGDYSPDGKRLVFFRGDENGPVGLFVIKLNGSGLRQITPPDLIVQDLFGGSWSPTGKKIVFAARTELDHRLAIWVVNADGSGLHQLPITPSCGGAFSDARSISCREPGWSPDGTKIVFTRATKWTPSSIYTVNADGSGLFKVTNSRGDIQPDWGPHPLAG